MSIINQADVRDEIVYFLRNADILTTTERSVTTDTDTGTFASDSSHTIAVSNIKNIRSIVVGGSTLVYGQDYTYNVFAGTAGSRQTDITFTVAQTGAYTITYDFGTGAIFPDYPRNDLSISAYPRIAVDIVSETSEALGFGNQKIAVLTSFLLSTVSYSDKTFKVREMNDSIKTAMMNNQNGFFYFKITLPQDASRITVSDSLKDEIFQQTRQFISITNVERI